MNSADLIAQMTAAFTRAGQDLAARLERYVAALPRGDQSGWYYIDTVAADAADGRHRATVRLKSDPAGAGNPAIGPLPCLRTYTPVVGQRVLVRWIAGDRADGVIEG